MQLSSPPTATHPPTLHTHPPTPTTPQPTACSRGWGTAWPLLTYTRSLPHTALALGLRLVLSAWMPPGFLAAELAATWLASALVLATFHIQHVFRPASNGAFYLLPWVEHSFDAAALQASAVMWVPHALGWATLASEFHQVHHWNPKVPTYIVKVVMGGLKVPTW